MKEDVHIRVLDSTDTEAFRSIRLLRLEESPTAFGTSYSEEATKPLHTLAQQLATSGTDGSFVLGAFYRPDLIGMVGISRQQRIKYRHKADLWGMYVIPEWRRQGVGQALLDAAISRCRTMADLQLINLMVNGQDQAAHSLYRSRGFEVFGREKDGLYWGGAYYEMEYMQLRLV